MDADARGYRVCDLAPPTPAARQLQTGVCEQVRSGQVTLGQVRSEQIISVHVSPQPMEVFCIPITHPAGEVFLEPQIYRRKPNCIDLEITDDFTGQVKG